MKKNPANYILWLNYCPPPPWCYKLALTASGKMASHNLALYLNRGGCKTRKACVCTAYVAEACDRGRWGQNRWLVINWQVVIQTCVIIHENAISPWPTPIPGRQKLPKRRFKSGTTLNQRLENVIFFSMANWVHLTVVLSVASLFFIQV